MGRKGRKRGKEYEREDGRNKGCVEQWTRSGYDVCKGKVADCRRGECLRKYVTNSYAVSYEREVNRETVVSRGEQDG